ncbi:MAG: phosphatidate cytidylyltransferase [Planctomycetaceae bacterium]|nr:phosphatidate cytidylyltransferase [Planctomycetaceae bacterium]
MLRWRLIIGSLLILGVGTLAYYETRPGYMGWLVLPVSVACVYLATDEMIAMFAARGGRPLGWVTQCANLLIVLANWLPQVRPDFARHGTFAWPMIALAVGVILAFLVEMARYDGSGKVTERLAMAVLPQAYVGVLFTFLIQLRLLGPVTGILAICSLLAVVKCGDIGAYTVGRLIGRNKMVPLLSPGKTWEGFAGGVLAACFAAWCSLAWVPTWFADGQSVEGPGWHWMVYGLLVGTTGVIGDLAESLLKRDAGVKDSSRWLPGFGGVLDILDSILLAAPVAYLGWIWP